MFEDATIDWDPASDARLRAMARVLARSRGEPEGDEEWCRDLSNRALRLGAGDLDKLRAMLEVDRR